MASGSSGQKPDSKSSEKKQDNLSKQIGKFVKTAVITSIIFLVAVFILGEAYALYAVRSGSALILWLPVFILVAILFAKVLD